jgi:hypothetical protein
MKRIEKFFDGAFNNFVRKFKLFILGASFAWTAFSISQAS